jgi:DNA-binding transcriptional MocR family regulator
MDDEGLVPAALDAAISSVEGSGRRAKFLYTIPSFHNPAGVTMPPPRRQEIAEICRRNDLLIVEDNPYGLLGFDAQPLRALRADDAEGVVYLGSFSKTFAPGLRVGWVQAPHAVREKLVLAQESSTLCPPTFSQLAVSAYLSSHDWRGQIRSFAAMYRVRRDAMLAALSEHMPPGTRWTQPGGGFYVWVTLPPGLDAKAMLSRAVTARVAYVPGTAFYADGYGSRCMRLSFCYPSPERIVEGVRRLGRVIADEIDLRATFGATSTAVLRGHEGPTTDLA